MARKVNLGNGKFIQQTNKKRPGRHSKSPNKRNSRKEYRGQGRKQQLDKAILISYILGNKQERYK